jgi:hypothetical protein
MTQTAAQYAGYEPDTAAIMRSSWSTDAIITMVVTWCDYDSGLTPIRQMVTGIYDQDEARAWYKGQGVHDDTDEYVRYLAAEALAHSGWTIGRINYRRS